MEGRHLTQNCMKKDVNLALNYQAHAHLSDLMRGLSISPTHNWYFQRITIYCLLSSQKILQFWKKMQVWRHIQEPFRQFWIACLSFSMLLSTHLHLLSHHMAEIQTKGCLFSCGKYSYNFLSRCSSFGFLWFCWKFKMIPFFGLPHYLVCIHVMSKRSKLCPWSWYG